MTNAAALRRLVLWGVLAIYLPGLAQGQMVQQLSQVKTIYVEPLAGLNGANELREALIKRLEKSGRFQVATDITQADGVMKGEGGLWIRGYNAINFRSPAANRVPVYGGYLSVQLTSRTGEPLWSYLVTPSNLGWKSVVDDMTSALVKELVAARDLPTMATSPSGVAGKGEMSL